MKIIILTILSLITLNCYADKPTAFGWYNTYNIKTWSWWYQEIKFWKYNQAITIFDNQIKTLKNLGYSNERIIDLLAIRSMECNSYKWDCKGLYSSDIGPFQINHIHKKEYKKSKQLFNEEKWGELFIYQAKIANWLLDSYEKRFCSEKIFKEIWKPYDNNERFVCYARVYNWSEKKKSYWELAKLKRVVVEKYFNSIKKDYE